MKNSLIILLCFAAGVLCSYWGIIPECDDSLSLYILYVMMFLVAPQQRKAKQRKILIFNENRDFLFPLKTQKSAVHDRLWWSKRWSKRMFQISPP